MTLKHRRKGKSSKLSDSACEKARRERFYVLIIKESEKQGKEINSHRMCENNEHDATHLIKPLHSTPLTQSSRESKITLTFFIFICGFE